MLLYIILLIVFFECIAQFFIRKFHELPRTHYYIIGVVFYAIVSFLLHKSYSYSTVGMAQALWSGLSIVAILSIGTFVFGEKIESHEIFGVLVILAGVSITQAKGLYLAFC